MKRDVFHAIADPRRRAIIQLLALRKMTLNTLAEHFDVSRPAISKHVKVLEECGLIQIEQHGRERRCEARLEKLGEVTDWAGKYKNMWESRLDKLAQYLNEMDNIR